MGPSVAWFYEEQLRLHRNSTQLDYQVLKVNQNLVTVSLLAQKRAETVWCGFSFEGITAVSLISTESRVVSALNDQN